MIDETEIENSLNSIISNPIESKKMKSEIKNVKSEVKTEET